MVQHYNRTVEVQGRAGSLNRLLGSCLFLLSLPILATAGGVVTAYPAFAASRTISIFDCEGNSRLTQSIPETSNVTVAVDLTGEGASTASPELVQKESDKTILSSRTENNRAFFDNVGDGSWSICGPNGEKIAFSKITVQESGFQKLAGSSGAGLLEKNGGIIGASAATVGVVAMAVGSSSSSSTQGASAERGAAGISMNPSLTPSERRPQVGVSADDFNDEDFDFGAPAAPVSPFE